MNRFATLLSALCLCVSLSAQVYPGGRGIGRGTPGGNNVGPIIDAVATFDGVFKAADKKYIEIQVESGDTVRMYLTHGTKFVRDGKNVKVADFHEGDKVTADATRDSRLNLLAVKIEAVKPGGKTPADKSADDKK
jgi:hypothetical protein